MRPELFLVERDPGLLERAAHRVRHLAERVFRHHAHPTDARVTRVREEAAVLQPGLEFLHAVHRALDRGRELLHR